MSLAEHYETVRDQCGYDPVTGIDWLADLERRFVAVDGRETVAAAPERDTIVCMGVGMTGPPHLGTVGQMLTAVELQEAGVDVQLVIAELEPYHGGADWDRVQELARRYRAFALDLGFDPDKGRLRTQYEGRDAMATAHRLARCYRPDEWDGLDRPETEWEQAVHEVYEQKDREDGESNDGGPTSEAAAVHSGVLHGADFLHPLTAGYEQVVISLGIDEHGLTPWARRFRDAVPDEVVEGPIAGLHTRMVPAFDGGPKMSKSIDAGLSLDAPPEGIRERIERAGDGGTAGDSADAAVFAAMCLASRDDVDRLDRIDAAREAGGEAWADAKAEYAEYVARLAERWRATTGAASGPEIETSGL